MFSRFLIAVAAAAVVLGGSVCAKAAEVLNFGIISTESSQNLKQLWDPFLADMEKATGFKVKAFFASDYAGIIEGMRFKKVDLCWIGNKGAIQMVDRSDGSVFAQTTAADGTDGYYSLLVVNKESPLKSVDDVLKNAAGLRFSNGDPNSTSGFLVPGYYVFAKNNVDPKKIFKNVVAANHESNALAVANRQVDVATCNNEAIGRLEIAHPEKAAQIREIWRSPLIPSDPLVWRNSLPESTKKKIADFIFGYGVKGDVAHAKAILEKLQWGPFKPSTNAQLVPLRQLELFREKSKLQANAEMPAAEKAERIKKIKMLEQRVYAEHQTQLFIETPYRNNKMVEDILQNCRPQTRLCIAANITCEGEYIRTKTVKEWKGKVPELSKIPCIFLLYQ